jgi:glycosyltransferase involved in cell wall biosynthesis
MPSDHHPATEELDVVIIIPVYNDPQGVRMTIESLRQQVIDTSAQIHVIDNGSTDNTPLIIEEYASEESINYHTETDIQSSYAARNTGIRNADCDILAFVDADMTVPGDWLATALSEFQTSDADYMGCNVELTMPDSPTLPARYDYHTGFPVRQYLVQQQFAPTCCLFVRSAVFEEVGLFDQRLVSGGDKEFGNRVSEAGYDLHFTENVTMCHPTRNSLNELISKERRVGRGLYQLQRYHPDRYGTPGVPPRPSGIKRPKPALPFRDWISFSTLSAFLTGVRGLAYYESVLQEKRGKLLMSTN